MWTYRRVEDRGVLGCWGSKSGVKIFVNGGVVFSSPPLTPPATPPPARAAPLGAFFAPNSTPTLHAPPYAVRLGLSS